MPCCKALADNDFDRPAFVDKLVVQGIFAKWDMFVPFMMCHCQIGLHSFQMKIDGRQ